MRKVSVEARLLALAVIAPLLGGCPGQGAFPPAYIAIGQKGIVPTTQLQVGHLYFEGQGRRPVFALADGTIFSELCYADFGRTAVLANITKYTSASGAPLYAENTTSLGATLSANVTGIKLGILSASASGTYNPSDVLKTENARVVTLSAEGAEIVRKSIGGACKSEIAGLLAQGKRVILVADAVRADKGTFTSSNGFEVGGGVSVGGSVSLGTGNAATVTGPGVNGKGGRTSSSSTTFTMLYLSIVDSSFTL
ncbi:hypothetical protein [Bradyrhizobium sp. TM239]|uniref:hypothetical protein n=1 Tax=Bradyrhizobium sp. TM239 TaxID=2599802 RepID=UPI0027D5F86E|nr:hypothetical protein TM239_25410 [Bradyrhizobium sp. TM239]